MSLLNTSRVNSHSESRHAEKRRVRAITRIRPFFATEKSKHETELESCVVPIPPNKIAFRQQKYNEIIQQTFKFDAVYHFNTCQQTIFSEEVSSLIGHTLNGKKCTVFCYGPTGSGKTFTAFGSNDSPGIMARSITQLLAIKADKIQQHKATNINYEFRLKISSLEIYNEKVYDLLSKDKNIHQQTLHIRQNGSNIVVQGLIKRELTSMQQFYDIYQYAMKRRKTAFTALNAHSSRSHAIFTVYIEQKLRLNASKTQWICGKISIADLAGSENNKRTLNRGERLKESKNINKSLLALGAVIDALKKRTRPPYRDSILTRLLSDCLGGDSISTMICCVSGLLIDSSMTRRCLEFGSSTRKIENKVIAHIENKEEKKKHAEDAKMSRKRKRIANDHMMNKRKKIKYQALKEKEKENKLNISIVCNESPIKPTKRIRYKIKPTPSKFVPKNSEELEAHEEVARHKLISKIDQLTAIGRNNAKHIEQLMNDNERKEAKEEERELSVYRNDEFGLPPTMTPNVANPALAVDMIKEGRKLEKNGKIHEALVQYKRAKKLLPEHKRLGKKIQLLELNMKGDNDEKVVKILSFEESTEPKEEDKEKKSEQIEDHQPKKRSRRLRKKANAEIMSSGDSADDDDNDEDEDGDVDMFGNEYSFSIDVQRVLDTMNKSELSQLKTLVTVGPKKAAAIVAKRPFNKIHDLKKVHGLHTCKTWKTFIESNRLIFEQHH